jgi:hypothetical protein
VCFERPNYFCGHLLSDDDLNAGQNYFREKNKLYHRTLHGSGVVCGLRMTRDLDCPGQIVIGDGFAIDACGNDLVVCEPANFNLMQALKDQGYLVSPPADPCSGQGTDDCMTTQCFYVVACYDETKADFESPFQSSCNSGPASCEPTRIQEGVKFQVLDKLPKKQSVLDRIEEQIACCLKLLEEGTFAATMQANAAVIQQLFDGQGAQGTDYFNIFCQLKVYFQQYLKKCPDLYDAALASDVAALKCPANPAAGQTVDFGPVESAFCALFQCVVRYITDCITGQLIFSCPAPETSGEVILGTVEIVNGKLAKICHCSRNYVWAAANLIQVLIATLALGTCQENDTSTVYNAAGQPTAVADRSPKQHVCCSDIDVNCRNFVELYAASKDAMRLNVTTPLEFMRSLSTGLKSTLNIFDPNAVPLQIFQGMEAQAAIALARKVGINLHTSDSGVAQGPASQLEQSLLNVMVRPGDSINAMLQNGKVAINLAQTLPTTAASATDFNSKVTQLSASLDERDKTIAALQQSMKEMGDRLETLEKKGGN